MTAMKHRPIIDAGPGLNFLSLNKERLLIAVTGPLSAPEAVQIEVFRKARTEGRFQVAERVWNKLGPTYMEVLSDELTTELNRTVQRISRMEAERRIRLKRDLGELMVLAHAVVLAEEGHDVTVLIDDSDGRELAEREIRRLDRLRNSGKAVGSIELWGTIEILQKAAASSHIPNRGEMRKLYERLRPLDTGLPPLESTDLLSAEHWQKEQKERAAAPEKTRE